jgi:hypothetical protein
VHGIETGAKANPGCRCKPGSPDLCGRCQRLADGEEELLHDPERHPEYEERVQAAERNHEAWLDRIGGSA